MNRFPPPLRFAPLAVVAAAAVTVGGCAVGPDYQRPATNLPSSHRSAVVAPSSTTDPNPAVTPATATTESLAHLPWRQAFKDPILLGHLETALTNNWDVRLAAARVLQAEAAARIAHSGYFPTISAGGDLVTARSSRTGPTRIPAGVDPQSEFGDAFLAMPAYEIDLWGKIRRANEAARARLLASIEARNTVRQTLVAAVATSYLQIVELDLELAIARRTLAARQDSLELTRIRESGGVSSMQDVHQAQILVSTAEATIADRLRTLEQRENEFNLLLGRYPGPIARRTDLAGADLPREVRPGLPASLLERRPDIRAAEQQLVAANADVGQAKAAFFPQLTLTGTAGFQSVALSDLFTGASRTWQFGPAVTLPLFTGGRLRGNLKVAEAQFQAAVTEYQRTVQTAFREVSDALVAHQRTREFRTRQEERTQAHRGASELAGIRYRGGVTSYLEVLYNEQELFNAELALGQARLGELLAVVSLYRALGGGDDAAPTMAAVSSP